MKGYIRVDGNPIIGMGHVSRCLSIALELKTHGIDICFVLGSIHPKSIIIDKGFECKIIKRKNLYTLDELIEIKDIITSYEKSFFIVDSYDATDEYLLALEEMLPTFYIDGQYRCCANISGVINYNAAADLEEYSRRFYRHKTSLMIGTNYTPVKEQFVTARNEHLKKYSIGSDKEKSNILLTTGSTDHVDFIESFCKTIILKKIDKNIRFHIVLGKMYNKPEAIENVLASYQEFKVYHDVKDMSELMKNMDVAISAAGTTIYELLCVGVPTISYGTMDIHSTFEKLTPNIVWIGDIRSDKGIADDSKVEILIQETLKLINSFEERERLHSSAVELIDGQGATRIANRIINIASE